MLAVSLHAVRDELRNQLVPLNPQISDRDTARRLPQLSGLSNASASPSSM